MYEFSYPGSQPRSQSFRKLVVRDHFHHYRVPAPRIIQFGLTFQVLRNSDHVRRGPALSAVEGVLGC
jgi:hypothetical protein